MGVNYISPRRILCDSGGCLTRLGDTGDQLVAWDYGHLTDAGSAFLVGKFAAH
ncbi:SGNH hydrolase domain-containing protein [Pseudomonas aeruginosa]|uniref:SGNH hydrolase domain-containing protein n=1 Tax=Pseudomonas aeruginosa TaxID=287 RepID=UPI003CF28B2F